MKIEFTPTDSIGRNFPPVPMKKAVPNWYKNAPTELGPKTALWFNRNQSQSNGTIRKCMPVLDYLTSGYVLKTQSEILISSLTKEDEPQEIFWRHASKDSETVSHHPYDQCPVKIQDEKKTYIKFRCGYIIRTPPGYSCLFYQSPYFLNEGIELFPAIVDTDLYDGEIFFPGFVTKNYEHIEIPPGTPMVTVFPFKRENWDHVVSDKILDSSGKSFFAKRQVWINDVYRRFFRQEKEYK
jgi:hypothetical protein